MLTTIESIFSQDTAQQKREKTVHGGERQHLDSTFSCFRPHNFPLDSRFCWLGSAFKSYSALAVSSAEWCNFC